MMNFRLYLGFLGLLLGGMGTLARAGAAEAETGVQLSRWMRAPEPETRVYAVRGDQELRLQFFRAAGATAGERRPAIIWIHGGGWIGGTPDGTMPHARYFAHRGLAAFNLTYRLARPEGPGVADCLMDCRSALRYIRARAAEFGVDPARIAVAGDSAGGHLTAALGTIVDIEHEDDDRTISSRPDAMILFNPVVDLTEGDWIRFAVGGSALADRRNTPRPDSPEARARAKALSPLFHVTAGLPPALLVHARADRVVPLSQAERFARAVHAVGGRCDLAVLEDPSIGHAFVVAGYKHPEPVVVDAIRRADAFLGSMGWLDSPPTLTCSDPPAW